MKDDVHVIIDGCIYRIIATATTENFSQQDVVNDLTADIIANHIKAYGYTTTNILYAYYRESSEMYSGWYLNSESPFFPSPWGENNAGYPMPGYPMWAKLKKIL